MAKRGRLKSPTPDSPVNHHVELVHRYNLEDPEPHGTATPATYEAAFERLRNGNSRFATFMNCCRKSLSGQPVVIPCNKNEVGLGDHDHFGRPKQSPFAVVVACSDAREPAEVLFGQGFDDLFMVRVAGNVLGDECVGSVIYALDKFAPAGKTAGGCLKVIVVVGHRNCGAVHAAVEAHESDPASIVERISSTPHPLAAIVNRINPIVTVSAWAIDSSYGPGASKDKKHTEVLTELAVYLNAAWSAHELAKIVNSRFPGETPASVAVRFGVFDLGNDFVQGGPPPYASTSSVPKSTFAEPPDSPEWFPRAAERIARSFAKKFPHGDEDMKESGYTFSAWHRHRSATAGRG